MKEIGGVVGFAGCSSTLLLLRTCLLLTGLLPCLALSSNMIPDVLHDFRGLNDYLAHLGHIWDLILIRLFGNRRNTRRFLISYLS